MRKVMVGLLMAASAATPLAAQVSEPQGGVVLTPRYERQAQRNAERVERREQRQDNRVAVAQRQQAMERRERMQPPVAQEQRQAWQGQRGDRQAGQGRLRDGQGFDRGGDRQGWQGRTAEREALRRRIDESRAASEASAQGVIPSYRRQAERNQERYERRLREDFRDRRGDYRDDRRADRRDWRQDRDWSRDWNRGWRSDRRYDWRGYRNVNRYVFSPGRYYAPYRGYSYRRFDIGFTLDPLFFTDRYWLNDPWQYRLPPAYAGTQWVRYFDDVLLVDTYTGEVVDVIHDFFW